MPDLEEVGRIVVDSAFTVHTEVGPGLLESAYKECLAYELISRGLKVRREVPVPLIYRGVKLGVGYRIDLLVENRVITEVKAVSKLLAAHDAQLLSHLRLKRLRLGYLLNFHEPHMRDGIRRKVNGYG